jgi:hypothetical protein
MTGLDLRSGQTITTPWRGPVNVTSLLAETVPLARAALLAAAQLGRTITYGQLSVALDGRYPPIALGNVLDLVSYDCQMRREPSLAALVIRGDTNEPGDAWIGDAHAEQKLCFEHWA